MKFIRQEACTDEAEACQKACLFLHSHAYSSGMRWLYTMTSPHSKMAIRCNNNLLGAVPALQNDLDVQKQQLLNVGQRLLLGFHHVEPAESQGDKIQYGIHQVAAPHFEAPEHDGEAKPDQEGG